MDFKYLDDFNKLSSKCPPEEYKPKNMIVFRWVFDDIANANNFLPLFYRNPRKYLAASDIEKCKGLAISFFDSEENAKSRFYYLKDSTCPIAYKVLGTNVATGEIKEEDGVNEEPNKIGHFNHHPIKTHNYEERFEICSKL